MLCTVPRGVSGMQASPATELFLAYITFVPQPLVNSLLMSGEMFFASVSPPAVAGVPRLRK